jgi:hypothetical protein
MIRRSQRVVTALAVAAVLSSGACSASSVTTATSPAAKDAFQALKSDVLGSLKLAAAKSETSNSVAMDLQGTSMGKPMSGHGIMAFRPARAEMTLTVGGSQFTVRRIDSVIYLRLSPALGAKFGGKGWLKFDLLKSAAAIGMNTDELTRQLRDNDPVAQVKQLIGSGSLRVVGEEDVNGVPTVHYVGSQKLTTYLAKYGKQGQAMRKVFAAAKVDSIGLNLWVDQDYRLRRATTDLGSLGHVTATYTKYGLPVDVIMPPPTQTVDLFAMLKAAGR